MDDNGAFELLKDFIKSNSFVDEHFITLSSGLEEDLKLWGDEAVEFIIAFGRRFNVDVSNFMAADYFTSEGSFYFLAKKLNKHNKKELRVHHLQNAIKTGSLNEITINEIGI